MESSLIRFSKFLSLVLRHKPDTIKLALTKDGWAEVDELIEKSRQSGVSLTKEILNKIVEQGNKKRFSFSEDGQKIRANYGHSIPVDLSASSQQPPEILFHGTAMHFLESIRQEGLLPQTRLFVHLTPDKESAIQIGKRHGKPLVFCIQARKMHRDGFKFYDTESDIWLTEWVPLEYIDFEQ